MPTLSPLSDKMPISGTNTVTVPFGAVAAGISWRTFRCFRHTSQLHQVDRVKIMRSRFGHPDPESISPGSETKLSLDANRYLFILSAVLTG